MQEGSEKKGGLVIRIRPGGVVHIGDVQMTYESRRGKEIKLVFNGPRDIPIKRSKIV